jgi:hypothetical protein
MATMVMRTRLNVTQYVYTVGFEYIHEYSLAQDYEATFPSLNTAQRNAFFSSVLKINALMGLTWILEWTQVYHFAVIHLPHNGPFESDIIATGPFSLPYNGYRVFPGDKERPGRYADLSRRIHT